MRYARSALSRSAAGVYLALAAQIATFACLVVFEEARGKQLARQVARLGGDPDAPGAKAVTGAMSWFAVLVLLVVATTVAAGCSYFAWLRRAGATPRMIAIAWFVPVLNLAAPALLLHALRQDAGLREGRRRPWLVLLAVWWACCLAMVFLLIVRPPFAHAPHGGTLTGLGPAELVVAVVAALLCAATVKEVTQARVSARPSSIAHSLKLLPALRSLPRHTYPAGE
ncbi:hypothetical protein Sme01_67120 [Sphaerisporangium melleum]|uniref:DUF4328 domain-containing protein n=1 Tax=Sphaerisporangium melleum TaxID=321316 RepID=A0A917VQ51_9ACTN|nr:hypothetical protein [Sphaerisporangium melleum]GGL06765.1 hypothetical protein GCM10007964_56350 [Sphaerisporangium melleum]GII74236.1 hypothetical protein Sme01_67120 [Sphaerisporangium melleum]